MVTLSLLIPTYNRSQKLSRLLKIIEKEINTLNLNEHVKVLVSDNASIDDTPAMLSEFSKKKFNLQYIRQPENIGAERNMLFLYQQAKTEYIWYIADDDIPLQGAISKIYESLNSCNPDVLLFSFIQPPGVKLKTFNFPENITIIREPKLIVELVSRYPKVSTYVLRKTSFTFAELEEIESFIGYEFIFLDIAFSVLQVSKKPTLCILSEHLATCDEDYRYFNFDPKGFLQSYKVFYHPFVKRYLPYLAEKRINVAYYTTIHFLFAVKTGFLIPSDFNKYDMAIKDIEYRFKALVKNPRVLFKLFIMKNNLVGYYKTLNPLLSILRGLS